MEVAAIEFRCRGLKEGWKEGFRIKPHFGICAARGTNLGTIIETEKIGRGTDYQGEQSRHMF